MQENATAAMRNAPALTVQGWGRALCLGGAGLGAVGLLGWLTGVDAFVTIVPGQPPMMPNTGLALLLAGLAAALRYPRNSGHPMAGLLSALAAAVVLGIGVGTIAEYVLELPFSIDQLVFRSDAGPHPGRPSPQTAVALVCLAGAILSWGWRLAGRVRLQEGLILWTGLIALTALLGQTLGAGTNYQPIPTQITGVALHTALALFMISVGSLLERPDSRIVRIAASPSPGSMMLRRLAPAFILIALSVSFTGTRLLEIIGSEYTVILFASLTVFGIAVVLPLFAITAKHLNRAHDALEQSRRQARDLIDLASDGIFISDLEARFIDVNEAGCRMLGYSREEIIGKTIMDLLPPEDEERLRSHRTRLLEGRAEVGEWKAVRKDGVRLPVEVSAKILPDGRWLGFLRDVSERKHAEEKLRLSEAKFSGIVSISADAIISIDEAQRITLFNEGAEKTFGWSSAEVIGRPLDILIPKRFRAIHARHVAEFAASGVPARRAGTSRTAIFGLRRNGEEFPADASISALGLEKRKIFTVALRDITEQKRAERRQSLFAETGRVFGQTVELEERLTNIARLVVRELAAYCIVDLIEDDGSIRRAKVVCRDPSKTWICDALMRTPLGGTEPLLAGEVFENQRVAILQKITPDVIDSWARNEEERIALQNAALQSAIATPLLAHGRLLGGLVLLSDASAEAPEPADLRMIEGISRRAAVAIENARLYRAAKQATRARDEMLGIVAHDLRNPLAAIAGTASVLRKRGTEPGLSERIEAATKRMNRLILDLLYVTQMEAGRLSLEQTGVEASEVISDTLKAQTLLAASSSLELRCEIEPDLPQIWADKDRLLQVFENLIGNAIKFTKPGGQIRVRAAARAGEVLFSVTDTGSGIASDQLPHIFDRYWQGPKGLHRGTGLGLAIVKGIVEAHGGRVWVESSLGQGSTFFFTVPAATQAARRIHEGRRSANVATGKTFALNERPASVAPKINPTPD